MCVFVCVCVCFDGLKVLLLEIFCRAGGRYLRGGRGLASASWKCLSELLWRTLIYPPSHVRGVHRLTVQTSTTVSKNLITRKRREERQLSEFYPAVILSEPRSA